MPKHSRVLPQIAVILGCLCSPTSLVLNCAAEDTASFSAPPAILSLPNKVTIEGKQFAFSETELISQFTSFLDSVENASKQEAAGKKSPVTEHRISLGKRYIATSLLAAAEFAKSSPELDALFDRTLTVVGSTTEVPSGITPISQLYMGMVKMSFANPADESDSLQDGEGIFNTPTMTFNDFVSYAKLRIAQRIATKPQ